MSSQPYHEINFFLFQSDLELFLHLLIVLDEDRVTSSVIYNRQNFRHTRFTFRRLSHYRRAQHDWNSLDAFVWLYDTVYVVLANCAVDFCALFVCCYKHNVGNYRNRERFDGTIASYKGNFLILKLLYI